MSPKVSVLDLENVGKNRKNDAVNISGLCEAHITDSILNTHNVSLLSSK